MQKNSGEFSMRDAMRFAETPAGRQLLAMLQQSESGRKAMQQAASGDIEQAKKSLQAIVSSPEVQALLNKGGGQLG